MINEIQKRPFVRPLILWITGTLLSLFFTTHFLVICLVSFSLFFLLCSGCITKKTFVLQYDTRWVWGVLFSCLLLALSAIVVSYTEKNLKTEKYISALENMAIQTQQGFVEEINQLNLSDEEKSVLATLTLGYRKTMDREIQKRFSLAGVSHILSVSGFHVAVVCGFLSFFFCLLPRSKVNRWIKYIVVMVLLWSFVLITGLAAPSVRAGIMYSLYLTGSTFRRVGDSYNTLAAAAFCMLAYNPYYLFDIGFQLSYIAVFSILFLQPRLKKIIEVRNPIIAYPWEALTVTVAAQIGTVILCLYYFGQFSLVFLFTNLPLTLLSTLLIPLALLWLLLPSWLPGIQWLQMSVEYITKGMVGIVDLFGSLPGSTFDFRFDMLTAWISYGALFLFLLYSIKRKPWMLLMSLSLILVILVIYLINRIM